MAGDRNLQDLVFVGFNSRVVALDRYTGELVWDWKARKGSGFVSLLLDGDRLIASVQGYTYCLDPVFGQEVWFNPLKGLGVGIPSIVSGNGSSDQAGGAATQYANQQNAAAGGAAAAAAGAVAAG